MLKVKGASLVSARMKLSTNDGVLQDTEELVSSHFYKMKDDAHKDNQTCQMKKNQKRM